MPKRLVPLAVLVGGLVLLSSSPAAAEGCGALPGVVSCTSNGSSSQPSEQRQPAPSSAPAPSPQPSSPKSTSPGTIGDDHAAAARILQLVNKERSGAGLAALEPRAPIASIAARHSRSMAGRRDIWHNDAYFTASTRSSLQAKGLGENVAMNSSIDDAHRRLMASPGHRANILNGSFDAVGMAVVHDEQGTLYVTQNFVDSATGQAPSAPKAAAPVRPASPRVAAPAPPRRPRVVQASAPVQQVAPAELDRSADIVAPSVEADAVTASLDGDAGGPSVVLGAVVAMGGLTLVALLYAVTRVLARP
ncbi:MAG: CAP domain-containing protein [Actinomycetota bacterium]|nr:CAP domain-containing protein [Actinomycetota bacterium]